MLVWTIAVVGIVWLLTRHAEHALRFLPLLFLVACPLMHLFHHRRRH